MALSSQQNLIRVTAWIPKDNLKYIMKKQGSKRSQSQVLRGLVDDEVERLQSQKAHLNILGIAKDGDFDGRFF